MSDGARKPDPATELDGDGVVIADETIAAMAAHFGVDPAVIAHECALYAWHMNELIAAHERFDTFEPRPDRRVEQRRWAADQLLTDGRGGTERSR